MSANSRYKVKVSSKGQVVIPSEIRGRYGYTKGTELIVKALDENRLLLERVPRLSELFGFLGKPRFPRFCWRLGSARLVLRMKGVKSSESKPLKRLVFDAGPFILLFTNEEGSEIARRAVLLHEKRRD